MSITPKMLGSQISSGTLRVMCNEGGPVVYGVRTEGSSAGGFSAFGDQSTTNFIWHDENHIYEYNKIPSSITIYDISYSSDNDIQITFNRTIYVADFMIEENGYSIRTDAIHKKQYYSIGFIGRRDRLYYFSLYNPYYCTENGSGSTYKYEHYFGLKFNVYEILIGETEASISTKTFTIINDKSQSNNESIKQDVAYYCKIITEDDSDLIKILLTNNSVLRYYKVCNLSDIINNTSGFTSVGYPWCEIFDKDKILINNGNTILQYNHDTLSYDLVDFPESNIYNPSSERYFITNSSGVINLRDNFFIYTLACGTILSPTDNSSISFSLTSSKVYSFKNIIMPYCKDIPILVPEVYYQYNDKYYARQSRYKIPQSVGTLALSMPASGNLTGLLYAECIKGHPFLCNGKAEMGPVQKLASVTGYTCYSIEFFSKGSAKYSARNTKITTIYPEGFYASNLLIEHNNRFFGISRLDYYGGNSPYESLMVSTMDYDPDADTFDQSFAGYVPVVAKSKYTREVVSINMARIHNKNLVYFDSGKFDYGNTCKIILRNANTGKYVTIYTGEIKEVFDYSSHPIIIEPGYELFVLTTYEAWQCTAFGIEIS